MFVTRLDVPNFKNWELFVKDIQIFVLCAYIFRSLFDIHHNLKDPAQRPPQQVFVSCNFCGNSILTNMLSTGEDTFILILLL